MTDHSEVLEQVAVSEALTVIVGRLGHGDAEGEGSPEILKLGMTTAGEEDFRELVRLALERAADAESVAYDVDAELKKGQVFVFSGDALPAELAGFATVAAEAATATPVAPSTIDARSDFHAVVVGDDQPRTVLLRKSDPVLDHGSTHRIFALGGQQLKRLEGPVFRFGADFDAIVGDGWAVVLNQHRFEQLFRDSPAVRQHIAAWAEAITDHLPMSTGSADALQEAAISDSRLWRKLRTIHRRGHLAQVGAADIRKYAESMDVDADAVLNADDELVFDSSTRFNVIHLLNEDLFRGPLTEEAFEAHRKTAAS